MKLAKLLTVALAAAMAVAILAPVSSASELNQLTKLTFNEPVRIPGNRVLAAGTYWFRLLNGEAFQNVVEIYNANRTQLDALLMARTTYRTTTTNNTEFTVARRTDGRHVIALMKWFYPDRHFGQDFLYSPQRLRQFREAGTRNVITTNKNVLG
jgi:hypothetical protein